MLTTPQKTTVLTQLSGTAASGTHYEPHGCLQTVMDQPAPGFIRLIMLGSSGLQVRQGDNLVVIPTAELLALVEKADPDMQPPTLETIQKNAAANAPLVAAAIAPQS